MTCFIAVVWEQTHNVSEVCLSKHANLPEMMTIIAITSLLDFWWFLSEFY